MDTRPENTYHFSFFYEPASKLFVKNFKLIVNKKRLVKIMEFLGNRVSGCLGQACLGKVPPPPFSPKLVVKFFLA